MILLPREKTKRRKVVDFLYNNPMGVSWSQIVAVQRGTNASKKNHMEVGRIVEKYADKIGMLYFLKEEVRDRILDSLRR